MRNENTTEVLDKLLEFQKEFVVANGESKGKPFVRLICNFCLFVIEELRKDYEN